MQLDSQKKKKKKKRKKKPTKQTQFTSGLRTHIDIVKKKTHRWSAGIGKSAQH
jgi:hypothetical protein